MRKSGFRSGFAALRMDAAPLELRALNRNEGAKLLSLIVAAFLRKTAYTFAHAALVAERSGRDHCGYWTQTGLCPLRRALLVLMLRHIVYPRPRVRTDKTRAFL